MRRHDLRPFVFGSLVAPAIVVAHEFGHFVAGYVLGLTPQLTYGSVKFVASPELLKRWMVAVTAAGPAVELVLSAAGLWWLSRARRRRPSTPLTFTDWLATSLALAAGRWLRCFTGTPANPKPEDEAFLSHALGLPVWVLPYGLAPLSIVAVGYAISLHPEGMRLIPFSLWIAGGALGLSLWFYFLGPTLLPIS